MFELIVGILMLSLVCIVVCFIVGLVLLNRICELLAKIASIPSPEKKSRFRVSDSPEKVVSDLPPQAIAPHIGNPPRAKGGFGSRVK